MQLCFLAHLEQTRMRWESGQVSLTNLKTREASVQECNGVESVCNQTLTLSLGWLCAQADSDTPRCYNKILHSDSSPCTHGRSHSTTRSLANALRCGVAVTGLHAHIIFSAKSKPFTARVPVLLCNFPKISGTDVRILANVFVVIHDAVSEPETMQRNVFFGIPSNFPMFAAATADPAAAPVAADFS